jgi:hypothetical protein
MLPKVPRCSDDGCWEPCSVWFCAKHAKELIALREEQARNRAHIWTGFKRLWAWLRLW